MIQGSKISNRHWKLKQKARILRSQGLSYKEILEKISVSKSSISLWCRDVPLTKEQLKRLWEKRPAQQLKGIQAIQRMFWGRRCKAFQDGCRTIVKVSKSDQFIAGLMLYWAEGTKSNGAAISNSDPRVIRFMVRWFQRFFKIKPTSLSIHLHLHSGQNEVKMKEYWSKITGVPLTNFHKSFIKPEGSGYRKNILYNGTVKVRVKGVGSSYLLFRILGAIAEFLSKTVGGKPNPEQWMQRFPHA